MKYLIIILLLFTFTSYIPLSAQTPVYFSAIVTTDSNIIKMLNDSTYYYAVKDKIHTTKWEDLFKETTDRTYYRFVIYTYDRDLMNCPKCYELYLRYTTQKVNVKDSLWKFWR